MILLVIDTASTLCAACVWDADAGRELGRCVRDIGKGHAEQLMGLIDEALADAGRLYSNLGAVSVAIGPGSFTGIRVGVSTARGLALALGVPSSGVTTLDALAEEARTSFPNRTVLAAIDAGRGEFYIAAYALGGERIVGPAAMTPEHAVALLNRLANPVLAGSAAPALLVSGGGARDVASTAATADIASYACLAVRQGFAGERPKPLYLREADAKPQASFVLPRREV